MLIKKQAYLAIKEQLKKELPNDIIYIDLWNNQPEMYQDEFPIAMPAVFVEFLFTDWNTIGNGALQHGDATIKIHIAQHKVSDSFTADGKEAHNQEDALERFDIVQKIHNVLQLFACTYFKKMVRKGSEVDVNHDSLIVDAISYTTTLMDKNTDCLLNGSGAYNKDAKLPDVDVEPNEVPTDQADSGTYFIPE